MREPFVTGREVLHDRLIKPLQVPEASPPTDLPPYMESFLAHLRMLVGVPFEYLVPDSRLLPPESIRFFYLDRSWTDRLVDGANAVGQIGSREQAHYHGHAPVLTQRLDLSERMVRSLQRGDDFDTAKAKLPDQPANVITGFVMRSSAVSGWPHMDVRAYRQRIQEPYETSDPAAIALQLTPLRIERLAPSVLIALFDGEPQMVILEEPHHGVQFGIRLDGSRISIPLRDGRGSEIRVGDDEVPVDVPMRVNHGDVVRVAALRDRLQAARAQHPTAVDQTGSAAFAISVLDPPWRQHFEGTEDHGLDEEPAPPRFVRVADTVRQAALSTTVEHLLQGG